MDAIHKNKPIHFYKEIDSRDKQAEYYGVYLAPFGKIGSVHSFLSFEQGVITMTVNPSICYEFEVRQAFIQYKNDMENK